MKLKYQLNQDNYYDYQYFTALNNRKVQKKSLNMTIALVVLFMLPTLLFWRNSMFMILASIVISIAIIIFFPKYYWYEVGRRIKKVLDSNEFVYQEVKVSINGSIVVDTSGSLVTIEKQAIQHVAYTKDLCIIYYLDKQLNSLLIPLSTITIPLNEFEKLVKE